MLSPSSERPTFAPFERVHLLGIAREAVSRGLDGERGWLPAHDLLPASLVQPTASFVTLRRDVELLGCIGSLEPRRALSDDVATNAWSAAFADPRLPAVTEADFGHLTVHVSVLGPLEPIAASSLAELARSIRPDTDGVLVVAGRRRGTFLPSVWRNVADTDEFFGLLWQKAGLRPGAWPRSLRAFRYQTAEIVT